jgi:hypothetical protein
VHLGDERARRVDRPQTARTRALAHGGADAVCREDDARAGRHVLLALDEDRAAALEVADDVDVVDDLLADVDRLAEASERVLDRAHGAVDAGAVAPRRHEHELSHGQGHDPSSADAAGGRITPCG